MNACIKALAVVAVVVAVFGCKSVQPELKSPCVGAPGSPCSEHPVNGPALS